jgi:hypothetical protein
MAEIERVEVRPSNRPTVVRFKGYEYVTSPPHTVRILVLLTDVEKEIYSRYLYTRQGSRPPFGALRTEWDRRDPQLRRIIVTYHIHDNPYKVTDPHRIVEGTRREIKRWMKEHQQH